MNKNTLNFIYGFILLMLGIFVFFLTNHNAGQSYWQIIGNISKSVVCLFLIVLGLTRMNDSTKEQ